MNGKKVQAGVISSAFQNSNEYYDCSGNGCWACDTKVAVSVYAGSGFRVVEISSTLPGKIEKQEAKQSVRGRVSMPMVREYGSQNINHGM